jgi:hypothetical protein
VLGRFIFLIVQNKSGKTMSLLDIAKKIKGHNCLRMVKYTGQELTITGASVGMGTFKIDIGSVQNKVKEINAVPPVMMAMDNNQFLLCMQAAELRDDQPLKETCIRIRLMHIMAFTQLQALLSVPMPSEELSKQILEWTKQMNDLTLHSINLLGGQYVKNMQKTLPKVPADIAEIMKYQGIDEAELKTAVKIYEE